MTNEIINSELLNEDQLDEVVGGSRGELSCDTKFLHALGLMDHYYEPYYVEKHVDEITAEVSTALKKIGSSFDLRIEYSASGNNEYRFISSSHSGRCTTRPQLYQYIC